MFLHLIANEPTTEELTYEEYEEYRNPGLARQRAESAKDESEAVEPDTVTEVIAPFQGTRAEAIKTLQERGFEYKQLRSKTKQQLVELL